MLFNNNFVLASSSSSRYNILKKNKLSFFKKKPTCNENTLKKNMIKLGIKHKKISLELARLKAKSVSIKINDKLIVGSDTVISFDGRLLNKAKNLKDAKKKIKILSGKKHNIYSSASVFYNMKEVWKTTQKSTVEIRELNTKEIEKYLSKTGKKILGSVGCYQVEALGPSIIKDIKGDLFNVMGFPLFPFLKFLKKYVIKKQND